MAVKTLAIIQGEINFNLQKLNKKAKLLLKKEKNCEASDHILEIINDNLNELIELFQKRKKLRNQIEKMKQTQINLIEQQKAE